VSDEGHLGGATREKGILILSREGTYLHIPRGEKVNSSRGKKALPGKGRGGATLWKRRKKNPPPPLSPLEGKEGTRDLLSQKKKRGGRSGTLSEGRVHRIQPKGKKGNKGPRILPSPMKDRRGKTRHKESRTIFCYETKRRERKGGGKP